MRNCSLYIVFFEENDIYPITREEVSINTYSVSNFSSESVTNGKDSFSAYRFTVNGEKYGILESDEITVEISNDSPNKVEITENEKTSLFTFTTYEYKNYRFY